MAQMIAPPKLAVVVVFETQTAYTDECILGLLAMSEPPHRLILVPDRRIDDYESAGEQVPCVGSVSAKRNVGARTGATDCDLIAYIDSDAYPAVDWTARGRSLFQEVEDEVAILTGPNLTPESDSILRRICGVALESALIMGEGALFYRGGGTRTEVEKAYTCNLFVRTSAFLRSGGFDEALLNNEDLALCEAVRRDGGRIVYDPEVVVHHHRRDLLHFWLSWFNEGLALPDYGGFRHRGWWLAFLPSVAVIFEACVLALGGLLGWLALQLAQLVVFFIERFARTRSVWLASGAALAMWGFLKAFGVGGLASPFVRRRRVLRSRHDPKTEASFSAPTPGRDERAAVGSGSSSPEAEV